MHCVNCHEQVDPAAGRFCSYCGAPLRPGPWRPTARLLVTGALVVVLVAASLKVYRGLEAEHAANTALRLTPPSSTTAATVGAATTVPAATPAPTQPPPTTPAPTVAPLAVVKAAQIQASRPTGATQNSCGQVESFDASFLQDGDFTTAWRVKGKAVGQQIRLRLGAPTRITEVGMVPGWAKVDGCDGADLFRQHRTVAKVRWIFDGGVVVEQSFAPAPDLQTQAVDVVTRNVVLQILATNEPSGIDMTPISEIRLGGRPA